MVSVTVTSARTPACQISADISGSGGNSAGAGSSGSGAADRAEPNRSFSELIVA